MNINLTLIGQMITFAIFVWFTMKFVWPPLKKAMDERNKKIADGLAFAEKAGNDLELAKRKANEIILDSKAQSAVIIDQANDRARRLDEQAKEDARYSAEKIKIAALKEIETEKEQVKSALKAEIASIAMTGAEKILNKSIDKKANKQLLDELAAELD